MTPSANRGDQSSGPTSPARLTEPVRRVLAGKRFALVNFSEADFTQLSRAIEEAQGFARRLTTAELKDPTFDVAVFHVHTADTSVMREGALLLHKPFLLAGTADTVMLHLEDRSIEARDFILWPAHPTELLMRAFSVLTGSSRAVTPAKHHRERPLVLVADDDSTTTMMVKTVLQRFGMDSETAGNGKEAMLKAQELMPDVLLLDVNMPFMDGFEVLSSLKRDPTTQQIFVVMLTSVRQEADIARGFALGADDYIVKPFNPIELVARVKRLVKKPV